MREIIAKLPPETYPILAEYFGRIAADLEKMSERRCMAQACIDKFAIRTDALKASAKRAAHLPQDDAISQMQRDGYSGDLAMFYLEQAQREHARAERAARDQRIATMLSELPQC